MTGINLGVAIWELEERELNTEALPPEAFLVRTAATAATVRHHDV